MRSEDKVGESPSGSSQSAGSSSREATMVNPR
jgi:hypothetical protein